MDNETVIPIVPGMKLRHPVSGVLSDEGGEWLADQFTFRLIGDGTIKRMPPGSQPGAAEAPAPVPAAEPAPKAATPPAAPSPAPAAKPAP